MTTTRLFLQMCRENNRGFHVGAAAAKFCHARQDAAKFLVAHSKTFSCWACGKGFDTCGKGN